MNTSATQSNILRWALIAGIVIVVNLFFNYAISLVYKAPQYDAYFPQAQVVPTITNQKDCIGVGGQWSNGYCNPDFIKQQQFQSAQQQYDKNVFILLVLLGVVSIIVGALFDHVVLSVAFSWAGVLSLLIASMRYWSDANNLLKVIILAVALGSLIWVAIKKFA